MAQNAHEDERVDELVGMRGGHDQDGTFSWHFPGTAWVHFAEEEVNQHREGPEEGIVGDVEPGYGHGRKRGAGCQRCP